jgi:hypothetical protein
VFLNGVGSSKRHFLVDKKSQGKKIISEDSEKNGSIVFVFLKRFVGSDS